MVMPQRQFSAGGYRYGFNGKENDNEVKGEGKTLDFGARIYGSRLGRWLSTDPLQSKYPNLSPYNFAGNSPITFYDPNGKEIIINYKDEKGQMQSLKYIPGIKPAINNHFVQQIHNAVTYVMKDDPSKVFQELSVHKKIVTINEQLTGSSSHHEINSDRTGFINVSINWGANFGQMVNGSGQAPSTILLHEAGHALGKLTVNGNQELEAAIKSREFDGTDFTNKEERRVITTIETPYIKAKNKTELYNIKYLKPPIQGTRNDHYGEYYPTTGVNSITPIDGKTKIQNTGKTLQDEMKPKIDGIIQPKTKQDL
jgi:RHS repeat-associated protein